MYKVLAVLCLIGVVVLYLFSGGWNEGASREGEVRSGRWASFGEGAAYGEETLGRFQALIERGSFTLASPPRNPQGMLRAIHRKTELAFVLIPAGSFQMGSPPEEEGRWDGEDLHAVTIGRAFLFCETECTQRAWERGGGESDSKFQGADRPVECVSWEECHAWCERNGLRLPSEAEWEYACRAGSVTRFSFGDDEERLGEYAVYWSDAAGRGVGTKAVGGRLPNAWGLYDMHGNVWEWCEDWYGGYDEAPDDGSARTAQGGASRRVRRGGGWFFPAVVCRSANRGRWRPSGRDFDLGFRPALSWP